MLSNTVDVIRTAETSLQVKTDGKEIKNIKSAINLNSIYLPCNWESNFKRYQQVR
jgi:hypothetical protein